MNCKIKSIKELIVTVRIGQGETASVRRCSDQRGNKYALKFFNNNFSSTNEIEALLHLSHANIIKMQYYEENFVVLDLMANMDLFTYVQSAQLDQTLARTYFRQIIQAIDYMHSQGYINRDIKLENVLMD